MNNLHLTIYTLFVKGFTYKNGSVAVFSIPTTLVFEQLLAGESFFGISIGLCFLLTIMIIVDFFTGIAASKKSGGKIKSYLLGNTFYKCLMIFLFFWGLFEIHRHVSLSINIENPKPVSDFVYSNAKSFITFIRTFVFILVTFREWISIGENLEKVFGKQPYIFQLTEKLFRIIEEKFLSKVKNSDILSSGENNKKEDDREEEQENNRRDLL